MMQLPFLHAASPSAKKHARRDRIRERANLEPDPEGQHNTSRKPLIFSIPWTKPPSKVAREIIPPAHASKRTDKRPIRAETRAKLVQAIAQGRRWVDELLDGTFTSITEIATRERCSLRQVNRAMTLAFLSPRLVEAAVAGQLPRGIGVATIRHLPAEWSQQHAPWGSRCKPTELECVNPFTFCRMIRYYQGGVEQIDLKEMAGRRGV